MRVPAAQRVLVAAVIICAAGLISACNLRSSSPTTAPTARAPGVSSLSVPIKVSTDSSDTTRAVVRVSVGGGPLVPVLLDTGSAGLRILPGGIGQAVHPTGQTDTADFGGGGQLTSSVVSTTVRIGGISTNQPTLVSVIESSGCVAGATSCTPGEAVKALLGTSGAVGILGIAMADGPTAALPLYSPLLQLPAPYRNGFSLSLPLAGHDSFRLGTPVRGATSIAVPMVRAQPGTYPNGMPAWQKDVDLCWTLHGTARACGATDLDIGDPQTIFATGAIGGLSNDEILESGTSVAVATPRGRSLWTYAASDRPGRGLTVMTTLPGSTRFNTGIGFFASHQVGYNAMTGRILVSAL